MPLTQDQQDKKKLFWLYGSSLFFIIAGIVGTIFEFEYVYLFPALLLIALLATLSLDKLVFLSAILVPPSINFQDIGLGLGMILPSEPLIIGIFLLGIFKFLIEENYDKKIIKHPISIAIIIYLGWMAICIGPSSMPLVSLKFWLAKFWYVFVFYYLFSLIIKKQNNISAWFWAVIIPLSGVIVYVVIRHAEYQFGRDIFIHVIQPFFDNHGIYSSMLAMFVPFLFVAAIRGDLFNYGAFRRSIFFFLAGLFVFAIIFSYTRAAWVSLMVALAGFVVLSLRINIQLIFGTIALALVLGFSFQGQLIMKLQENKQGSSSKDIEDHLQSATNITNDPSNLERLNRWSCAYRMFRDKPIFGFGPGTFTWQYAPYQLSYQMTIISTNFGTLGNAHSEYLGPLAEMGFLGFINWLGLVLTLAYFGVRNYYRAVDPKIKMLSLATILGYVTYFAHAFLNSYMEYDKIAMPFWCFAAIITITDLYFVEKQKNENSISA